jgi:hypothetical protein
MAEDKDPAEPGTEDVAPEVEDVAVDDTEAQEDTEADDEPVEDEAADEDAEAEEPPERPEPRSRASDTIRQLRADRQRLKRELESTRAPRQDTAAQQREYEAEQARLLKDAQDREELGERGAVARYFYQRSQSETFTRQQWYANQTFDREDRRDFREVCREHNVKPALRDYVEETIQNARANGNYQITREAVLKHRLGDLALQGRNERLGKQRERGERQILRQTVRPPRGGSDVAAGGSRRAPRDESKWTAEDYERQAGNITFDKLR